LREVIDLEHDSHGRFELDDLSTIEAKLFVIIKHGIHVFNPNCIYWTIEANPLSIAGLRFSTISDFDGEHTIRPLLCVWVEYSVKLVLSYTLWIDIEQLHIDKLRVILDHAHGCRENVDDRGLSGVWISNHHESMSYHYGFIKLDALVEEDIFWLQIEVFAGFSHHDVQLSVVLGRKFNSWEKITGYTVE